MGKGGQNSWWHLHLPRALQNWLRSQGTNDGARGRKREASKQGTSEVPVSLPHLFLSPLHPPICSQINRQWATKCCLSYLMLLITMPVQSQLSPQKQNIFMQHSKWVLFRLGQGQIEHWGLVQAKGALPWHSFQRHICCLFLFLLILLQLCRCYNS